MSQALPVAGIIEAGLLIERLKARILNSIRIQQTPKLAK